MVSQNVIPSKRSLGGSLPGRREGAFCWFSHGCEGSGATGCGKNHGLCGGRSGQTLSYRIEPASGRSAGSAGIAKAVALGERMSRRRGQGKCRARTVFAQQVNIPYAVAGVCRLGPCRSGSPLSTLRSRLFLPFLPDKTELLKVLPGFLWANIVYKWLPRKAGAKGTVSFFRQMCSSSVVLPTCVFKVWQGK